MLSRVLLRTQYKNFTKSIQNTKKFLKKNYDVLEKTKYTSSTESSTTNFARNFLDNVLNYSKNRVQKIAATGLVLNLDIDPDVKETTPAVEQVVSSENINIVSNAAEETVSQLLESSAASNIQNVQSTPSENSVTSTTDASFVESLPEPPPIPEIPIGEVIEQLNALGQPTFASLGLGGYSPVGLIQNTFEYLNVNLGIPWWEAIVIGTIVIRLCMFPLVVIAQRNAAKMNNNLPQLQIIQMRMTDARQSGNQIEAARYTQEMMTFMKEKDISPFRNMLVPLAQMPVFISFFMSLRQMSNLPVETLRTGGLWWFTDLTVPDQFFIMPIVTSFTLWATIELGTDSAKLSSQNMQTMKYILRALPVCILPFTVNFPGAVLVYWTASNFVSLAQVGVLKIPTVRDYFKIEKQVYIAPEKLPVKPKGFTEGIKESWTNMKVMKDLEERRKLDEIQFKRAGRGPIVKTFKYDPTKVTERAGAPIDAKKR